MSKPTQQSYQNHRRYLVGYHIVTFAILAINLLWWAYRTVRAFSISNLVSLLLGVALIMLFLYTRSFASANQDRIIRLEERLRLGRLLPADLKTHIDEFTPGQLIGLRFASDEELPELARKVWSEGIRDREQIKKMIRTWRPDLLRV